MRMIKPTAMLLGIGLAALAMAGTVPSSSAVSLTPVAELQAAAPVSSVVDGPACPDVMLIGARGTNEGPDNWDSLPAYVKDNDHGVGATIDDLFSKLNAANPRLVFSLEPVVFPTILGKKLAALPKNLTQYLGYAQIGALSIAKEILDTDTTCGANHVHYILAGYSLGAWAVHDALYLLNKNGPAELNEIIGVTLFGDPLFQPSSPINQTIDAFPGLAVTVDPADLGIPSSMSADTVGSWCFTDDPICQGPPNPFWQGEFNDCVADGIAIANGLSPLLPCSHLYYDENNSPTETAQAAGFLQLLLPPPTAPDIPGNVTAVATSQYKIQVTWTEASTDVTKFNIDNGCPVGSCGPGATLAQTTGPVNTTMFSVTPGSYQCFRVQAVNNAGISPWSNYGCISTPGLVLSATQKWTNTKVTVSAGDDIGITADGQISVSPTQTVGPAGDPSCTPAQQYPGKAFPAPDLPCYSLIARIGNGTPFEIGTRFLVANAAAGVLYLGINDNSVSGNSGSWNVNIKLGGL